MTMKNSGAPSAVLDSKAAVNIAGRVARGWSCRKRRPESVGSIALLVKTSPRGISWAARQISGERRTGFNEEYD